MRPPDPLGPIRLGRILVARRARVAVGLVGFTIGAFLFGLCLVGQMAGFGASTSALVGITAIATVTVIAAWCIASRHATRQFDGAHRDLVLTRDRIRAADTRAIVLPLLAIAIAGPLLALLIATRETLGFGRTGCLVVGCDDEAASAFLAIAVGLIVVAVIAIGVCREDTRGNGSCAGIGCSLWWPPLLVAYAAIALGTATTPSNLTHGSVAGFGLVCWLLLTLRQREQQSLALLSRPTERSKISHLNEIRKSPVVFCDREGLPRRPDITGP